MLQGRTKQRVEIKVERRQLFLLFLVGLLVTALTFSLGVMTGKRLNGLASGDVARSGVAVADKATELEKALKKDPSQPPPPAPAQPSLASKAAPEPRPGPAPAEKPDKVEKAEKPDKAAKEPAEPEKEKPQKAVKEKEPEKVATGPSVKEPKEPAEPAGAAGEFTLQIAAMPDRNQAVALAAQMEKKGYKTHISTAQVAGKGTMYRVRIGRFKTRDEADAFRDEYMKKEKGPCFVTPIK